MFRSRSGLSAQEVYPVRAGAVSCRFCRFGGKRRPRILRVKRIRGQLPTNNKQRAMSNERWGICYVGAAGICDGELDWGMDLADGAGNGRARKPRIRDVKTLQNLSQAQTGRMAHFAGRATFSTAGQDGPPGYACRFTKFKSRACEFRLPSQLRG